MVRETCAADTAIVSSLHGQNVLWGAWLSAGAGVVCVGANQWRYNELLYVCCVCARVRVCVWVLIPNSPISMVSFSAPSLVSDIWSWSFEVFDVVAKMRPVDDMQKEQHEFFDRIPYTKESFSARELSIVFPW